MNTTYHRYLAIALVASITSPFAGAQISGAVDSTINAATAASNATQTSTAAANAAASVNAATQASANASQATDAVNAATQAANYAANTASNVAVSAGTEALNGAVSSQSDSTLNVATDNPGIGTSTSDMEDVNAAAPDMAVPPDLSVTASQRFSITLDSNALVQTVTNATFESRADVLAQVDSRIDAAGRVMNEIRADAVDLQGETRQRFISSVSAFLEAETAVHTNLSKTRIASSTQFEDAREGLVNSLQAYAEAGAQLESTATAGKSE